MLLWPGDPWAEAYVINVRDCRAMVCRRESDGRLSWLEPADNWEDLEEEAIAAIEAQGGAINISGLYPCPDELAARAA